MKPQALEILNRHNDLLTQAHVLAQRLEYATDAPSGADCEKIAGVLETLVREITWSGQSAVLAPVVADEANALRGANDPLPMATRLRASRLLSTLADKLIWADREAALDADAGPESPAGASAKTPIVERISPPGVRPEYRVNDTPAFLDRIDVLSRAKALRFAGLHAEADSLLRRLEEQERTRGQTP